MSTALTTASQIPGFSLLSPKEQSFVLHPDVFKDPKKACLEVGYSSATASTKSWNMRIRLMRFIVPQEERRLAAVEISRAKVEEELAAIGFVDVTEYQERIDIEMPDGGFQTVVVWKDPSTLTSTQRKAIKAVTYGWTRMADETQIQSDRPITIAFHSKDKALHELAGLFGDVGPKNPASEQQTLFDNLEPAEREELVRIYQIAARRSAAKTLKSEGTNAEPTLVPRLEKASPGRSEETRDTDGGSEGPGDQPDDAERPAPSRRVRLPRANQERGAPARGRDGDSGDDTPQPHPRRAAPRAVRAPITISTGEDSDAGYLDLPR